MPQTTKSSKNLLSLINVAKSKKVGIDNGHNYYEDEIVEKSSFKNLNEIV